MSVDDVKKIGLGTATPPLGPSTTSRRLGWEPLLFHWGPYRALNQPLGNLWAVSGPSTARKIVGHKRSFYR